VLIVHYAVKTDPVAGTATTVGLERKILDPVQPIPPGAVWIDMVEPTVDEDRKVEGYLGSKVPSRSDPDYAQPTESYYAENGVRYLHACVVSEAEGTPDVADVTFILGPKALVTVRYDPGEAFDLFGQRLGKIPTQALHPDGVAVGLINAIVDRSARALNKVGNELDSIASQVFRAKGDQSARSKIYSATLGDLGREDEKISNLRESLVELERLVLFLMSEGLGGCAETSARGDEVGFARPPGARTGRELQGAEGAVPARRDPRLHQPRAERHHQAVLRARGHLHAADDDRLDLWHEFQVYAGAWSGPGVIRQRLF
jgi:CorA-like Mg2+ transporter protein